MKMSKKLVLDHYFAIQPQDKYYYFYFYLFIFFCIGIIMWKSSRQFDISNVTSQGNEVHIMKHFH